jgi:hypothetical protein
MMMVIPFLRKAIVNNYTINAMSPTHHLNKTSEALKTSYV